MRRAYNREYEEYICVDAVGELIRPRYVTEHFQVLLKQNGLRRIRFHDATDIIGLRELPTQTGVS